MKVSLNNDNIVTIKMTFMASVETMYSTLEFLCQNYTINNNDLPFLGILLSSGIFCFQFPRIWICYCYPTQVLIIQFCGILVNALEI